MEEEKGGWRWRKGERREEGMDRQEMPDRMDSGGGDVWMTRVGQWL